MWILILQALFAAAPIILPFGGMMFFAGVEHLLRLWRIRRNIREGREVFRKMFGGKLRGD